MPLFFFDVAEDGEILPDLVGVELARAQDARLQAVEIAIAFLRHVPAHEKCHTCLVAVKDGERRDLYGVEVRLENHAL